MLVAKTEISPPRHEGREENLAILGFAVKKAPWFCPTTPNEETIQKRDDVLEQTTGRRELVRAITVTVALLPILIVSGAGYGAGFTPAPEPMPAPSLEMQSGHHDPWFTLKDENPQQVGESRTRSGYFRDRSVPIAEPIPIVAIAGQAQPARTTAITSTVKPAR